MQPTSDTPMRRSQLRLREVLAGAHPALPRPLDRASEWWAGRSPRVRTALGVLALIGVLMVTGARISAAERRWGGQPEAVLVATVDLGAGEAPARLRRAEVPPTLVPPRALATVPRDAVLAIALPEGTVLTELHVAPSGPAAGLPDHLRAVPVPIEEGWGIVAGGWVDVWLLAEDAPTEAVARSRPVLELHDDGVRSTALVGLAADEVPAVMRGLSTGRLLLTHAPAPLPSDADAP